MQISRVMVVLLIVLNDISHLRGRIALVDISGRDLEPRENVMPAAPGRGRRSAAIKEIEITIGRVTGMKGHSQQSLFSAHVRVSGTNHLARIGYVHENASARRGQIR